MATETEEILSEALDTAEENLDLAEEIEASLEAKIDALEKSIDPDTLEAIADEIGGDFKHSARADSLRVIARNQRAALAI